MTVLVTASRNLNLKSRVEVWKALHEIAVAWVGQGGTEMVVRHGCAEGGDTFADLWVRGLAEGFPLPEGLTVHADRNPPLYSVYGRSATRVRNQLMVDKGNDVALCFFAECIKPKCPKPRPHWSHGTSMCRDMAEAAGIRVQEFYEESEVTS